MSDFEKYRKRQQRTKELENLRDLVSNLIATYEMGQNTDHIWVQIESCLYHIDRLPAPDKTHLRDAETKKSDE